ncbi:MAG: C-GCAxxG-C-C family protein [Armatimonadetes bacterium]|nr:C-GCAxxG-C-C family protein [Armatimonadota bacterium]
MSERTAVRVALEMFAQKFNCAEAVLGGLVQEFNLDCNCSPRIATAFGGGMAGQGEICGAITGAMMALGLKYGRERGDDNDSKALTYGKVRELCAAFDKQFGACGCFDLIGIDLTTPEGLEQAKEAGLHENICPKYVKFCAEKAAELIQA